MRPGVVLWIAGLDLSASQWCFNHLSLVSRERACCTVDSHVALTLLNPKPLNEVQRPDVPPYVACLSHGDQLRCSLICNSASDLWECTERTVRRCLVCYLVTFTQGPISYRFYRLLSTQFPILFGSVTRKDHRSLELLVGPWFRHVHPIKKQNK